MPLASKTSGTCQACKSRRIKCDAIKPTCGNCRKTQRICLDANAVKQTNFPIHVENDFASGKSKRPRGPRSGLIASRAQDDLRTRALTYYLNYHVQVVADMPHVPGCLAELISAWKFSGKSSPMVDLALSTMALAVFARRDQQPAAAEEATQTYLQLLRMLQDFINNMSEIRDFDPVLLTILLIGRYEGATHGPKDFAYKEQFKQLRTWTHHDGAMAVLKLWHDSSVSPVPTFVVKQARRGLIRSAFLRQIPLSDWLLDSSLFNEQGLELQYDRIEVRLVDLRHRHACLSKDLVSDPSKVDELIKEARDLDEALNSWIAQISDKYSYTRHTIEENNICPRLHFYSPTIYSFAKPGYAAVWLQYFSTRMLISCTHLRILACYHDQPSQQQSQERQDEEQRLHNLLVTTGGDLASSIPFTLGRCKVGLAKNGKAMTGSQASVTMTEKEEIKPYLATIVIWPLSIASGLRGLAEEQQTWFQSELSHLGSVSGDGIIGCAHSQNWVRF